MLKRLLQAEISTSLSSYPAVALLGPRQVGKTTLANQISQTLLQPAKYIDLESERDVVLLNDPHLFFERHRDKCVIIDEVQRMPHLFPLLRSEIDERRIPGRFLLLGSASPDLLQQSSESLAGRIAYRELSPFNVLELVENITADQLWMRGGFPDSLLAADDEGSFEWRLDFIRSYIERDLPSLGLKAPPSVVRTFWTMLAHYHGGIWNAQKFASSLGVTSPTAKRYMEFLEASYLTRVVLPYSTNVRKRLIKSPKIYIRDSGILHALINLGTSEAVRSNVILGSSWEGFVIEQIASVLQKGHQLFYYRTHDGTELDIVITSGGIPLVSADVKFALAPSIQKGFRTGIQDMRTENNFIITPRTDEFNIEKSILVCGIQHFIQWYISL